MLSILVAIFTFSLLVLLHEFGHFISARRAGIRVDEFGIGFPPRIWGIKRKGTIYSINLLPIGGFVKIAGEDNQESGPDSFVAASTYHKLRTLLAGVMINFLIGWLILTGLLISGLPSLIFPFDISQLDQTKGQLVETTQPKVIYVAPDSPASQIGLMPGDQIVKINNQLVNNQNLSQLTEQFAGKNIQLEYLTQKQEVKQDLTLASPEADSGKLGVIIEQKWSYHPLDAVYGGLVIIAKSFKLTLDTIGSLIVGIFRDNPNDNQLADSVTGPVGIVSVFRSSLALGSSYVLALTAAISISLGIMNTLPLPALDGGRALIVILRKLGIKISDKFELYYHGSGMVILLILMALITIRDINNIF
ncbi:site-2 protease family protein [Candidatus Saccharibacteria bacterium]|nr:site-2 protease family protein [Candidatus Saccharibacteria bacterium]MCB9834879.1 site-2 protease family protein [Candidatus Nomurabacteria bacterium]